MASATLLSKGLQERFVVRVAWVCLALEPARASELLQGWAQPEQAEALEALAGASRLSSELRRSLLLAAFETHPDTHHRLRNLLAEANPPMCRALADAGPGRARLREAGAGSALQRFAARLVREASS